MKVSLPNGVSVAPISLMPALWARTVIWCSPAIICSAVASSSGLAQRLRRSLVPSMTIACVTPGCASTSRSKRRRPLSPPNVVQNPVAAQSVVDDADRASTVGDEPAGQLVGPSAVGVDRRNVAVGQRVPERHHAARLARGEHIDAAQEEPLVRQIADRHYPIGDEIAGRRDVVGLPCIAASDREIRQHPRRADES